MAPNAGFGFAIWPFAARNRKMIDLSSWDNNGYLKKISVIIRKIRVLEISRWSKLDLFGILDKSIKYELDNYPDRPFIQFDSFLSLYWLLYSRSIKPFFIYTLFVLYCFVKQFMRIQRKTCMYNYRRRRLIFVKYKKLRQLSEESFSMWKFNRYLKFSGWKFWWQFSSVGIKSQRWSSPFYQKWSAIFIVKKISSASG